jgi:hypothetical protein
MNSPSSRSAIGEKSTAANSPPAVAGTDGAGSCTATQTLTAAVIPPGSERAWDNGPDQLVISGFQLFSLSVCGFLLSAFCFLLFAVCHAIDRQ